MVRTRITQVVILLGGALALGDVLVGCGGRQNLLLPPDDSEVDAAAPNKIGPVDLSQAPRTLAMTCDHGVGSVAFDNPCLVGHDVAGGGNPAAVGLHEVECTLATPSHPVTWAFLLPLAQIAAAPDMTLSFPADLPASGTGQQVAVGGRRASVSMISGTLTFSRVDPPGRAFVARLVGTMTWTDAAGATFSCSIDAPFWGAPGGFT